MQSSRPKNIKAPFSEIMVRAEVFKIRSGNSDNQPVQVCPIAEIKRERKKKTKQNMLFVHKRENSF